MNEDDRQLLAPDPYPNQHKTGNRAIHERKFDDQELYELFQEDLTRRQVALRLGVSLDTVVKRSKKMGLDWNWHRSHHRKTVLPDVPWWLSMEIVDKAIRQAKDARLFILDKMAQTIAASRRPSRSGGPNSRVCRTGW
jgi:hypothetical protein